MRNVFSGLSSQIFLEISDRSVAMSLLQILVVVLTVVYGANANPGGAPAAACDNLTPGHGGASQPDPVPYYIDLSPFETETNGTYAYNPGQTYTVTLRRMGTATFRGFFVQTRLVADDMTRTGVFAVATGQANTRLSSCPTDTDGITHVNAALPRIEFEEVTFDWTAPPAGTGDVQFAFAVVQTFPVWWSNRRSEIVSSASGVTFSVVSLLMALVPLLQL